MSLFKKQLSFLLCLFLFVSINSCKKDLLVQDEQHRVPDSPSGMAVISFDELQRKIKISKSGVYNSVLANNLPKEGKFRLKEGITLLTDKITMITANGIATYTMAVEQSAEQRATFQNITFVERAGVVETYLLTYKASQKWASRLKIDKNAPFEGNFSFSKLESNKSKTNKVSDVGCETFTYYVSVAHQCEGYNGGEYHWPWESCPWAGESNGPGYYTSQRSLTVCNGGGGNTWVSGLTTTENPGGGTTTYTTLPPNYNPDCTFGSSGLTSAKSSGINTSSANPDCATDDLSPPGLITKINKLTGMLGLDLNKQEFLYNKDATQGETFTSDFLTYLTANGLSDENIAFANYMIDYIMQNPNISSVDFTSQFLTTNIFSLPHSIINTPEEAAIDNGVTIETALEPVSTETPRLIGSTGSRGNTEDLLHGVNGNTSGIVGYKLDDTDTELFQDMQNLINTFTFFDSQLRTEANNMIDRFRNRTGGTYESPVLNYRVTHSKVMMDFVKEFGAILNTKVNINSQRDNIPTFALNSRPVFNSLSDRAKGFQILFNDTEQTDVYIENFTINPNTGVWVATVQVKMYDHFGLDKNDAIKYQNAHQGFAAWWILQHKRNYYPFTNLVTVRLNVSSSIY